MQQCLDDNLEYSNVVDVQCLVFFWFPSMMLMMFIFSIDFPPSDCFFWHANSGTAHGSSHWW